MTAQSGLIIVDKPAGWTSHDVVARVRRLAGTRRVGHAGTLDPMATGVLVVGVEKATRLLGHLTLTEKEYAAVIRLGQATDTGDAEGAVISAATAAGITLADVRAAVAAFTGEIEQVPPAVSAVKVGGERAYKLARAGQPPTLAARRVTVHAFDVDGVQQAGEQADVSVRVRCSSGTYIRALARDLGDALGVGGHLVMLRRTRVGSYRLAQAHTLADLEREPHMVPLAEAAAAAFPVRRLSPAETASLSHGGRLAASGTQPGPVAAISPDGMLVALVAEEDGQARPLAVFVP